MQREDSVSIKFHFEKRFVLANRKVLKQFLCDKLKDKFVEGGELNYIFCSDESILGINREYLNHDYYTDIITFELSASGEGYLVADIYISIDTVRSNAKGLAIRFGEEILRVMFHGVLHLLGNGDKSEKEASAMRIMENSYIEEHRSLFSR